MAADLVRMVIRMQFAEALRPWLEVRELFRIARGDEDVELQGDTPFVEHKELKQRVRFQVRAISLEQEGDRTSKEVMETALQTFSDMHAATPLPTLEQVRIDCVFVEPYELSFSDLRSLIRKTYLQPTDLARQATDIGVTLEQVEGHVSKNVKFGPMEPNQLQETYLHWNRESIPDRFLFVGLSFQWNVEMEFNSKELQTILGEARSWQESVIQFLLSEICKVEGA